jgi:hypothetical protein
MRPPSERRVQPLGGKCPRHREQLAAIKHLRNTYEAEDPNHPMLDQLDRQVADLEAQPGVGRGITATDRLYRRTLAEQAQAAGRQEYSRSRADRAAWRAGLRIRDAFGGVRE